MADIRFYDESQYEKSMQMRQRSFLTRLVLATGIVSTESQAEYVLLGIATLVAALAFWIFMTGFGGSQILEPPPVPPGVAVSAASAY